MEKNFEPRKDFFAKELNIDRMNSVLDYVISNLTLEEILKMIREISYDMICYYDEKAKGHIYNGEYSRIDIENATYIQKHIRDACDFFNQVIVDHHSLDQNYLKNALSDSGLIYALESERDRLKEEVSRLQILINELS